MIFLRSLLCWTVACISPFFFFLNGLLSYTFDRTTPLSGHLQDGTRLWARLLLKITGITTKIQTPDRLKELSTMDLPLIVTSNHNSVIDVLVLLNLLPFRCVFFAKNSIFVIPGYGWYMWAAGHIPVQRTNPRSAYNSLDKGEAKLKEGTSIVIFPEGSRSENGELQCFKSGFARLAAKSGAPIIPVAISGTHKIINKGSMLLHPASVKVSIGKPVFTNKDNLVNNKQRSELTLQVQEETLNILKELQ